MGSGELVDSMMHDGLFCTFDELGMGAATETYTKLASISREEQDAVLGSVARAGRGGDEERRVRRGDRPGPGAAAQG